MSDRRRDKIKMEPEDRISTVDARIKQTGDEGDPQAPLMVAMQPGVEVPAVGVEEIVVFTDGADQVVQGGEISTSVESDGDHMVTVGAIEEVKEEFQTARLQKHFVELSNVIGNIDQLSDNKVRYGRVAEAKRPPPSSSSETESEVSSDESDTVLEMNREGTPQQKLYVPRSRKLPKKRDFSYRLQWKNRDMLEAMKAVEEDKMTIRGAAKKFSVPYSTLKDRVHGRVRHGTKPGVKTALSPEEEEELVKYIKDMEAAGFQMRCVDIRDRAGELLRVNHGQNSPYREGSPGHNWLSGFLKRHPGIEFKRHINRNMIPSAPKQKAILRRFYDITHSVYKKSRLTHKPERIFTVTEVRINVFQRATILVAASADGTMIPPFVVFRGYNLKLTSARQTYPEAFFTSTANGYVNDVTFMAWFREHFLKQPNTISAANRPICLFVSRAISDISLAMAQFAKEERVTMVAVPPGVGHLLLPLDEGFSTDLHGTLMKKSRKWEEENPGTPFTQKVFAQVLNKVWRKCGGDTLVRKYAKNGVYPLNAQAISTDRIMAAAQMLRESQQRMSPPSPTVESNSRFEGLTLLSALSSHEYASIGNNGLAQESLDQSFEQDTSFEARNQLDLGTSQLEYSTPTGHEVSSHWKRRKLHSIGMVSQQLEEGMSTDFAAPAQKQSKLSPGVLEHMLQPNTSPQQAYQSHRSPRHHKRGGHNTSTTQNSPGVHKQIVAARENIDQINRAISSILDSKSTDAEQFPTVTMDIPIAPTTTEVITSPSPLPPPPVIKSLSPIKGKSNIRIVKVKAPKGSSNLDASTLQQIKALAGNLSKMIVIRPNQSKRGRPLVTTSAAVTMATSQIVEQVVEEEIVQDPTFTAVDFDSFPVSDVKVEGVACSGLPHISSSGSHVITTSMLPSSSLRPSNSQSISRVRGVRDFYHVDENLPQEIMQHEDQVEEQEVVEEEVVSLQSEIQEPQQEEGEMSLDNTETVIINGQMFRVVRLPPGTSVEEATQGQNNVDLTAIKTESQENTQLNEVAMQEAINQNNNASQEVVYEDMADNITAEEIAQGSYTMVDEEGNIVVDAVQNEVVQEFVQQEVITAEDGGSVVRIAMEDGTFQEVAIGAGNVQQITMDDGSVQEIVFEEQVV